MIVNFLIWIKYYESGLSVVLMRYNGG